MSEAMDLEIEYKISIKVQEWNELEERSEVEEFKNGNNKIQVRAKKLKGTWVKAFEAAINDFEDLEFKMLGLKY